jgi:hypothetical protein
MRSKESDYRSFSPILVKIIHFRQATAYVIQKRIAIPKLRQTPSIDVHYNSTGYTPENSQEITKVKNRFSPINVKRNWDFVVDKEIY